MKFFVTHYKPLTHRYIHITKQLENAGISDCTFILSKDREELSEEEIRKFTKISLSEISLFMKHIEVFKNAPEDQIIVVFEDDAILCMDFLENLNIYLSELSDRSWDVLFSGACCNLHCTPEFGHHICKTNGSRGTCMYVLNIGVGKKLYEIFSNQDTISHQIDWWFSKIHEFPNNELQYYWSEPPLVVQGSECGIFHTSLDRT